MNAVITTRASQIDAILDESFSYADMPVSLAFSNTGEVFDNCIHISFDVTDLLVSLLSDLQRAGYCVATRPCKDDIRRKSRRTSTKKEEE